MSSVLFQTDKQSEWIISLIITQGNHRFLPQAISKVFKIFYTVIKQIFFFTEIWEMLLWACCDV